MPTERSMTDVLFSVDLNKPMKDHEVPGHNRWHPDIPAAVTVDPGAVFRVECKDWTDGQISNNDDPSDIEHVQLTKVHVLSGPIWINGVEPGDILVVDILDIGPIQTWGYNGIFAKENGGSFLVDQYPNAAKSVWDFHGIYATSRHVPGVRFAGIQHPGIIGVAPSQELLNTWNKREKELYDTNPDRVPALTTLPTAENAVLGTLQGAEFDRVAKEGARTVPPRENGGNCDIKNLSRGSRVYFPAFVKGGKLSLGDLHFSQGDGEITFCGGIEMAGFVDLHVKIIKDGVKKYGLKYPVFKPGPMDPQYSDFLYFQGVSVDQAGKQHYLDANVAFKQACLNAIDYLKRFGFTGEQAYMLLSCAPVEGKIGSIVDIPNACTTLGIPTRIFENDINMK